MPDISDYYSGGSSLKADDIDDELTVEVVSWRKQKFDDGGESYFLKLKNQDKEFRVNKTNAKRIAEMYGKDIDNWVGKTLTLFPDVTDYQGKSVDTILVRVRRTNRNAPNSTRQKYDERNPPPPLDDEVPFMREDRA